MAFRYPPTVTRPVAVSTAQGYIYIFYIYIYMLLKPNGYLQASPCHRLCERGMTMRACAFTIFQKAKMAGTSQYRRITQHLPQLFKATHLHIWHLALILVQILRTPSYALVTSVSKSVLQQLAQPQALTEPHQSLPDLEAPHPHLGTTWAPPHHSSAQENQSPPHPHEERK